MLAEFERDGHDVGVVRVADRNQRSRSLVAEVVAEVALDDAGELVEAVERLNRFDAVIVQHEYGIYSGPDGADVIDVMERLVVPIVVVLHTVLVTPTPHQREVLEGVAALADRLVAMTHTARRRLIEHYDVDESKIVVIPHGAPPGLHRFARPATRPIILTWGLVGPGKGIERVIDALPAIRDLKPCPTYMVVGATHPRVLEREGERYRLALLERAELRGVSDMVDFRGRYFDATNMRSFISAADVVVLPYDSRDQVTSGVLVEAITARRPIIATAFAHAVEVLGEGAGIVVDHDDPAALASALRVMLTQPGRVAQMQRRAAVHAESHLWSAVAQRYESVIAELERSVVASTG